MFFLLKAGRLLTNTNSAIDKAPSKNNNSNEAIYRYSCQENILSSKIIGSKGNIYWGKIVYSSIEGKISDLTKKIIYMYNNLYL